MKLTKQIVIGLTEDDEAKCGLHIDSTITATEAFQLLGTLALHILEAYYAIAAKQITDLPTKEQEAALLGIKQSMYDTFDSLVSNVMNQFYPDAPGLEIEDEAILELTNKKIEERYNQLSEEEKEAYKSTYSQILAKLQNQHESTETTETKED